MEYHWKLFMADRALLEIPSKHLPDETYLRLRRRILASRKDLDQLALNEAMERQIAWKASGDPMPMWNGSVDDLGVNSETAADLVRYGHSTTPRWHRPAGGTTLEPAAFEQSASSIAPAQAPAAVASANDPAAPPAMGEEATAWDAELKRQLARHTRRRSAYPSVRPAFKEGKRSG